MFEYRWQVIEKSVSENRLSREFSTSVDSILKSGELRQMNLTNCVLWFHRIGCLFLPDSISGAHLARLGTVFFRVCSQLHGLISIHSILK
jgi:hypothetical protein